MIKRSFSQLIREELVKRFENLCADQIRENEYRFEEISKNIKNLSDLIQEQKLNLKTVVDSISQLEKRIEKKNSDERDSIFNELKSQRELVKERLKDLDDFTESLNQKLAVHPIKCYIDVVKDNLKSDIRSCIQFCEEKSLECLKKIHDFEESIGMRFLSENHKINTNHGSFLTFSREISSKLELSSKEIESSKKENQALQKRVLILEKKIEHLYMLMGRTPQGGEK